MPLGGFIQTLTMASGIGGLLVALPFAQGGATEAGDTEVFAVSPDRAQRLTVPVRLGEHGPFRFMIDTGSQNTVVSDALAERLGLPPGKRATVVGTAGQLEVGTVTIDELALGRRTFYSLLAPVLDGAHIGADGIVGLDGLQGQRVLLDFKNNVMAMADATTVLDNSGYDIVVTARRRSGQLVMTNALIDGIRVNVVIDTGSDVSIGNRALQKALSRRALPEKGTITSVTGQQIEADIGMGRQLVMDGLTFTNVSLAFADSPAFAHLDLDRKPAMLLGMNQLRLFQRVAIDFSSRKILFDTPWGKSELQRFDRL